MNTNITKMVAPHEFTHTGTEVLILRRIPKNRIAHSGFKYPEGIGATVEAKDFNRHQSCGGGLHGWPWGFGLGEGSDFDMIEDVWLILGAAPDDVIGELDRGLKCKCRAATIRYEGTFNGALDLLREGFAACINAMSAVPNIPAGAVGAGPHASADDYAKLAASGYAAKLAASGYAAQLAASGYAAQLAASGYAAQLAASGNAAKLAASGNAAQLAASGNAAKLAASGNDACAAIAAHGGKVKVGARGAFAIAYWTESKGWRFVTGKVGEKGIKAHTFYTVSSRGKLIKA